METKYCIPHTKHVMRSYFLENILKDNLSTHVETLKYERLPPNLKYNLLPAYLPTENIKLIYYGIIIKIGHKIRSSFNKIKFRRFLKRKNFLIIS